MYNELKILGKYSMTQAQGRRNLGAGAGEVIPPPHFGRNHIVASRSMSQLVTCLGY